MYNKYIEIKSVAAHARPGVATLRGIFLPTSASANGKYTPTVMFDDLTP
jgi:hypothetical protein